MNYLGFGLILQSFRGAVENSDFEGNVQNKPIVSAEKTPLFFVVVEFLLFPTRLLWFRAKMAF